MIKPSYRFREDIMVVFTSLCSYYAKPTYWISTVVTKSMILQISYNMKQYCFYYFTCFFGADTERGHWFLVTIELGRRHATLTYNHTQPGNEISNDEILESICTIIETAFCGSFYFPDR